MADSESWQRMVLLSLPPPAWLAAEDASVDVVLSTRVRYARNLRGLRFVHRASNEELAGIVDRISEAARALPWRLQTFRSLTNAERDYLVGCRLVSADFEWTLPGRALLIDERRQVSIMINEEDHLRLQVLTPALSVSDAEAEARQALSTLEARLEFAHSSERGYLTASPANLGAGRRLSVMFHLIALAQAKRLPAVIAALTERGITVRGLFGESSRAIGAFAQVSVLGGDPVEFAGACEYLLQQERDQRDAFGLPVLEDMAGQAMNYLRGSPTLSLANSLRVLAWARWGAASGLPGYPANPRTVDAALTTLELRGVGREEAAGRQRADHLRLALGL